MGLLVAGAFDVVRLNVWILGLMAFVVVLALAPDIKTAKLPGGTEISFRDPLEAADAVRQDLQEKAAHEGGLLSEQPWPVLVEITDEMRALALDRPGDALAELRHALLHGLRGAARKLYDVPPPHDPEDLVDFVSRSGRLWTEQASLIRVLWDLSSTLPLSGDVAPGDALRVLATAEILNHSFPLGYSINFEPNDSWEEAGLICQYEHCIEQMPLPDLSRTDHLEWKKRIQTSMDEGFYDHDPKKKAELREMLNKPIPADAPDEPGSTVGSCPVFGHYCPGGVEVIESCEAAQEWLAYLESDATAGGVKDDDRSEVD